MKTILSVAVVLLAAAIWSPAQSSTQTAGTQTSGAQAQTPAQNSGGSQQQQPADKSAEPKVKAAKTQPEYDAYQAAASQQDVGKAEAAANDFATKFADSDLRSVLYEQLMRRYQAANNAEKTLEMGRKVLALDPDSVFALVMVSSVLAERTSETDVDLAQRREEVVKDSTRAIQLIDTGAFKPAQFTADQLNAIKAMAYAAQGTVALISKDDPTAEDSLQRATQLNTLSPEASVWLRLAIARDHQKKYADALVAANRAVDLSGTEPDVLKLAKQEQTRLKQLADAKTAH
jgi:tetratricopeptide (TPR) repeat protein